MILVPAHAVWKLTGDPLSDASWHLKPYQQGEPRFYLEHIRRGVEIAAADSGTFLVFSGGQTESAAGPCSEALGYWMLAECHQWWDRREVRARAAVEEFALDSFQNLLFGICRFRECSGGYPREITVAGWGFKARRFCDLHRPALRFPPERFYYAAVNDPVDLAAAQTEEQRTCALFTADPYGAAESLARKRRRRNPFRRRESYAAGCPELAGLLQHHGPDLFRGPLPWAPAL